jgi:hypothetical protein
MSASFEVREMPGTGNNRAFEVRGGGKRYLLKEYFSHPRDPRDRLGTEFNFSQLLWDNGITSIPQPIAADPAHKLALYQFIEGRACAPEDVTESRVREFLEFLITINRGAKGAAAREFPLGSEPCFSVDEHVSCIARRLERLSEIDFTNPQGAEARGFVNEVLLPLWDKVRERVSSRARKEGFSTSHLLAPEERILSPSDFGFHNALITSQGALVFLDFEYAGWDDPARTTSDFFCQPRIPVPHTFRPLFRNALKGILSVPERYTLHSDLIFPVYQMKWCCIMLAEFLPVASERRSFAQGKEPLEARRARQMAKVRALAHMIEI